MQSEVQQTQKFLEETINKTQQIEEQQTHQIQVDYSGLLKQLEQQLNEEFETYKILSERSEKLKKETKIQIEVKNVSKEELYGLQEEVQLLQQLTKQIQMNIQAMQSPIHMLNTATSGQIEVNVQEYNKLYQTFKQIQQENELKINQYKEIQLQQKLFQSEKDQFKNKLKDKYFEICKDFNVKV